MGGLSPAEPCPSRVHDALHWAIRLFVAHQAESPRLDAELLLSHLLQVDRPRLLIDWNTCLTPDQATRYTELVRRALDDVPIPYLTGERAFYDVTLHVTPAVLIPRPETEQIVEEALAWAGSRTGKLRVVDVGTGSGALAVVLARHLPAAEVWATDISPAALTVARANAQRYMLQERIQFVQSDLLSTVPGSFDLIVANLPYIDPETWPELQASIQKHEPRLALDGGPGGTALIERLIATLPTTLARPGLALLECNPRQAQALVASAQQTLPDASVQVLRDLAGWERVIRIERAEVTMKDSRTEQYETQVLPADDPRAIAQAVRTLRRGELVVFPTDTVYGVGCDLWSGPALERLYRAKGRPSELAIPVLVSGPEKVTAVARRLPDAFEELSRRFWPGGLTIVLPRQPNLPERLTSGRNTVAVRLPDHPAAIALIAAAGGALAVTSANVSGRPAPTSAQEALADLAGRVDLVLDGGTCPQGVASSIVDLSVSPPRLLRQGALDVEALREILPDLEV